MVAVSGISDNPVIINAYAVVGVAGDESDLDEGGENGGPGGIELVDGSVLECEAGVGGAEDQPDDEDDEEDEDDDGQEAREELPEEMLAPVLLVAAVLLAHGWRWSGRRWRSGRR